MCGSPGSPRGWQPGRQALPAGLSRTLGIDTAADGSYSDVRTAIVGAATFFLPCGFTQAVQIYALSTANPLTAGLVMATFAVGTTPGLLALASVPEIATGAAPRHRPARGRRRRPRVRAPQRVRRHEPARGQSRVDPRAGCVDGGQRGQPAGVVERDRQRRSPDRVT